MMEDMLDTEEDQEIEQEADAEVDKILFDLTDGKLGQAGTVGTALPVCSLSFWFGLRSCPYAQSAQKQLDDEETERTMEQYRQQLNGILSS
jgi:charged multivesicular body protein 3